MCQSVVLCERATCDPLTGRIDLLNVLNQVGVPPGRFPIDLQFFVHVSLTGGQGTHVLEFMMDDPVNDSSHLIRSDTVSLRTPMVAHEHSVFVAVRLGAVGHYWVRVLAGGVTIGQRAFVVAQ